MGIKVGKKYFPKTMSGIAKAKKYSALIDSPIEKGSTDLTSAAKHLSGASQLQGLKNPAHNNLEPFKSGYNQGVDTRGGDTSKHSQTPRFKKDNIK